MTTARPDWTAALLVALVCACAAAPAAGREHEFTVFGGLHLGGEFDDAATGGTRSADEGLSAGLVLGFPLGNGRTFEVVWSHQWVTVPASYAGEEALDLGLDTVGIGGTYEWGSSRTRPFVSGLVGLTLLTPGVAGYDAEVLFSASLGGGVKIPISKRAAFRLEGRGVAMIATGGAAGVCGPNGCALRFAGAGLGQIELTAGLAFAF